MDDFFAVTLQLGTGEQVAEKLLGSGREEGLANISATPLRLILAHARSQQLWSHFKNRTNRLFVMVERCIGKKAQQRRNKQLTTTGASPVMPSSLRKTVSVANSFPEHCQPLQRQVILMYTDASPCLPHAVEGFSYCSHWHLPQIYSADI